MCHDLFGDARLFQLLLKIDDDFAAETRDGRCPRCGGVLHSARYPRKPRGGPPPDLRAEYRMRASFCCCEEECRKRATPKSVRFLGRRHYVGVVVVLASVMTGGITERRSAELRRLVGVGERTLRRWRAWWRETFPASRFWKSACARFASPVDRDTLPASLLERFGANRDGLVRLLKFLAPITTRPGLTRAG